MKEHHFDGTNALYWVVKDKGGKQGHPTMKRMLRDAGATLDDEYSHDHPMPPARLRWD